MEKKWLIVCYSLSNGNTRRIAREMQQVTGGDLAELQTVEPYTGTYEEIVEQGKREVDRGDCPALQPLEADLEKYDVIAVGTPTWWYTMAPAVCTFLTGHTWAGKKDRGPLPDPWRLAGAHAFGYEKGLPRRPLPPGEGHPLRLQRRG